MPGDYWHEDPERIKRRQQMADRYAELPARTREWLEGLNERDITTLNEAIRFQEQARTIGKFGKWLLISFAGLVISLTAFGNAVSKLVIFATTGKWPQ